MATTTPALGPLARFMRFTTQREPVVSVGVLVALLLYLATRLVPGLTDDDLQLLALIGLPIATALLARFKAWSPASVETARRRAYEVGMEEADTARLLRSVGSGVEPRSTRRPKVPGA